MKHYLAVFVCLFALVTNACGFSPMYGSYGTDPMLLNNVEIDTIASKHGQKLRNDLIDAMYRDGTPENPEHVLKIRQLKFSQDRLGLDKVTTAETRYQLTVLADFVLIDRKTKEPVYENTVRSFVAYNALDSQFTTIVARNDTFDRAIKQVSDRIIQDLTLYFGNPDKEALKPLPKADSTPVTAEKVKVFE